MFTCSIGLAKNKRCKTRTLSEPLLCTCFSSSAHTATSAAARGTRCGHPAQHGHGELGRTGLLRAKSPSPVVGAGSVPTQAASRQGQGWFRAPGFLPCITTHTQKINDSIHLFIQVELYSFTSLLATSCVFGTCLEWRVAGGFGSPPGTYKRPQASGGHTGGWEHDQCCLCQGLGSRVSAH